MKSIIVKINNKEKKEFCVNENNNGLFVYENGNYKQLAGTCDFSANTPQELMRKLKKFYFFRVDELKMVRNSAQGW